MTGNTIVPQVLGASAVGGVAVAALPVTGSNSLFSLILLGVVAIAAAVIVSRLVKLVVKKAN